MDLWRLLDTDPHPLLDTNTPDYSNATVRRAFIVWLRCGQRNEFRDVCNYYHRLEALEGQLPADVRTASRNHEFSLFANNPPTSPHQQYLFPHLYSSPESYQFFTQAYIPNYQLVEPMKIEEVKEIAYGVEVGELKAPVVSSKEIFDASQVFKAPVVEKANEDTAKVDVSLPKKSSSDILKEVLKISDSIESINKSDKNEEKVKGTSKQDIVETSQMIKNYCKEQQVPLKNFLENFKEYASRCELNNTVNNVGLYIKRKMVHSELTLAVMVHRTKINGTQKITKSQSKIDSNIKEDVMKKPGLLDVFSKLKIIGENNVTDIKTGQESELINKMTNFESDFITFEENSVKQKEKVIKLLKRR